MSAFVVDHQHINFLVEAGRHYEVLWPGETEIRKLWRRADKHTLSEVGQMLWDENIKSVRGRYPQDTLEQVPCKLDDYPFQYRHIHTFANGQTTPLQVLESCRAYEYQVCEHEEWRDSEACYFIEQLRKEAINRLQRDQELPFYPTPDAQLATRRK